MANKIVESPAPVLFSLFHYFSSCFCVNHVRTPHQRFNVHFWCHSAKSSKTNIVPFHHKKPSNRGFLEAQRLEAHALPPNNRVQIWSRDCCSYINRYCHVFYSNKRRGEKVKKSEPSYRRMNHCH